MRCLVNPICVSCARFHTHLARLGGADNIYAGRRLQPVSGARTPPTPNARLLA